MMFYRVFFNSQDFVDFKSIIRDEQNRPCKGIDKDGMYCFIGNFQLITLMPDDGEVIDSKAAWKAGF